MTEWLNQCHFGDVRDVLRRMIADGVTVQTIVTSPPYWGLRSYLPPEHPDKAQEIGSEPTLAEFLRTMVEVFGLCRQVLADDGTMWVNMGDSYCSTDKWGGGKNGNTGKQTVADGGDVPSWAVRQRKQSQPGIKPKDLMGQPWRLAFALQDDGWYLRQDIIWHKPNPMPESIKDRCTKAHEYIFLLSKSERYYFDAGAIREERTSEENANGFRGGCYVHDDIDNTVMGKRAARGNARMPAGWATSGSHAATDWATTEAQGRGSKRNSFARATKYTEGEHGQKPQARPEREDIDYAGSRNKRSVWTVATRGYAGAHFATFPPDLIEPCVLAGAPAGGTVLDIFFGSGTTGQVAQQLGRHWIGIDINRANEPLHRNRLQQPGLILESAA